MIQRWREKLKYIEAAILIIGTAVISVIAEKINKKEIEKMKCQEEEELKDIV